MKITDIKPQKRKKNRFNLYLDDNFFCSLSEDIIIGSKIEIGQQITKKELEKLIQKDQLDKALNKAIRLLSYRSRTENEIRKKLLEKKFDNKIIAKVIKKLQKMGYLSDQFFIESWIRDRINIKPSGKKLLKIELIKKGIPETKAQKFLEKLVNPKIELQMAEKAFRKAQKNYRHLTGYEKKQKITAYLARRGFEWTLIEQLLNKNK